MNRVCFTVPFVAVQQRARKGKHGWYSPSSKVQKAIGQYALAARVKAGVGIFQRDCHIYVQIYGSRGDGSNHLKLIEDAINGILWKDDKQAVFGSFRLIREADEPHMDVEVSEVW